MGENLGLLGVPDDQIFELVTASYMATEPGTLIEIFLDGDDDPADATDADFTIPLNEGDTFFIPPAAFLPVGALAKTNKDVQLHAMTGDLGATYESRWAVVLPSTLWGNEYYLPVGTRLAGPPSADPTDVFVYNPNLDPAGAITVSCEAIGDCTDAAGGVQNSLVIGPGGIGRFRVPDGSGSRFSTENVSLGGALKLAAWYRTPLFFRFQ